MAALWILIHALCCLSACLAAKATSSPSFALQGKLTVPGLRFPAVGLGTGGGGFKGQNYGSYPECWSTCANAECLTPNPPSFSGCPEYVHAAVTSFLQLGGRLFDLADSYHNQIDVGFAITHSNVPREEIFITNKVGPYLDMGYNATILQHKHMLSVLNLTYVDNLMLHWPSSVEGGGPGTSSDPVCQQFNATYDMQACLILTYKALIDIFNNGGAKSIGVSNFNVTHFTWLQDAGLPLPAVNQISWNLYHSFASEEPIYSYCRDKGILVNSWVPFARPDSYAPFPPPMAPTPLLDPVVASIAAAHSATPAQVMLAWQYQLGIASNPRSQNAQHMIDNLAAIATVTLSADEMASLAARPQYTCQPPSCTTPHTA